jgi:hypothetical protein
LRKRSLNFLPFEEEVPLDRRNYFFRFYTSGELGYFVRFKPLDRPFFIFFSYQFRIRDEGFFAFLDEVRFLRGTSEESWSAVEAMNDERIPGISLQ